MKMSLSSVICIGIGFFYETRFIGKAKVYTEEEAKKIVEENIENRTLYTKLAEQLTGAKQGTRMTADEIVALASYIQKSDKSEIPMSPRSAI